MNDRQRDPKPGESVVFNELPPGLIDGLPEEDQIAIAAVVGKPVHLIGYDDDGRVELEFTDAAGVLHFIYVNPRILHPVK